MIGILSFHHIYNYGAVSQLWALQRFLDDIGYDSKIIDVRPFYRIPPGAKEFGSKKWSRRLYRLRDSLGLGYTSEKRSRFEDFVRAELRKTEHGKSVSEVIKKEPDIDTIIVGSDQVWSPRFGKKAIETYFLTEPALGVRKISYAACARTYAARLEKDPRIVDGVRDFDYISVRDDFTGQMVENITSKTVSRVVDPSLLRPPYPGKVDGLSNIPSQYILYYGSSKSGDIVVEQLANKYDLPVVFIGKENDGPNLVADYCVDNAGPYQWMSLIERSSIVVTQSYHGTMYALNHEKKVVIVPPNETDVERLQDFCERFSLKKVLVPPDFDEIDAVESIRLVDWSEVRASIQKAAGKSREFIQESLIMK